METQDLKHKLEDELLVLEGELRDLGWENPKTGEWEATGGDIDSTATEDDELADRQEQFGINQAEVAPLEARWKEVKEALRKMDEGLYGVCDVCGEKIEEDRLDANPAARTCVLHMGEEKNLE